MIELEEEMNKKRLIMVSNRLPVVISKEEGIIKVNSGSGGLVTALAPVLKNRGGLWIGWPGTVLLEDQGKINTLLAEQKKKEGFALKAIFLTEGQEKLYYDGFSNEIIWPLFHDLQSLCRFDPTYWHAFQEVNALFAEGVKDSLNHNDFIWIHDYHLMLVGREMRKLGIEEKIAFFLHIPFPPLDIFAKLPWRFQVLEALLEYDLLGFQTVRDERNFLECVKRLMPYVKTTSKRFSYTCQKDNRVTRIGAFPISIDFKSFSKAASGSHVTEIASLHLEKFQDQKVIFSCDRLDMSKGIPYRLEAIRYLLKERPELHGKLTVFQVIVPSRTEIPGYQNLKMEIDRLVSEINSQFTQPGWVPIQYIFHSIKQEELIAFYRIADIALITPVKDGMNLVAKEYIASNVDEDGILILSEFAGASAQLQRGAILINPYDIEGVREAIYQALVMPKEEIKMRMRKMRNETRRSDIFWWVRTFLKAAIAKELRDFPITEEYNPK